MTMPKRPASAASRPSRGDRFHARMAGLGPDPKAIVTSPEPLWTGDAAAARRLAAGLFLFGGAMVEARGESPWDQPPPTQPWEEALHAFEWLDDMVAASDERSRAVLGGWLHEWVTRYGRGAGPGWRPDIAGKRLTRWICHAPTLLSGAGPDRSRAFFSTIGRQTRFLKRRWRSAPEGLPRFQAAAGLIYAGLAVEGSGGTTIRDGIAALDKECARSVAGDGGLPSRNPEHLVEVFSILVWAQRSLEEYDLKAGREHQAALPRLAAAIRALRLGDGTLTRFHGGGSGNPERIDRALAASGLRPSSRIYETMGFHRLGSARTGLIFDAGVRANGHAATTAHASAFCFEVSIGPHPMIVNCGPGARFGEEWQRASRATAAHSGLTIDNVSSARFNQNDLLVKGAANISCVREEDATGVRLIASHDGWIRTHGLVHHRRISLTGDGTDLRGEDRVIAEGPGPAAAFDQAAGVENRMGIPFTIRFHLHPDVEADIFLAGGAVRLRAPSGDTWVMRQLGGDLKIEDSVYLDEARVAPRATKQIVVRSMATNYRGQVKWAFRRAEAERPTDRRQEQTIGTEQHD
ncbi:MAG: heparinase II/III family protein [Pseudomonadota bacterium]